MDIFQLNQGRYLLYLDILGFKQLVRTRPPSEVYKIVDRVLDEFRVREERIRDFRTLYFSDTIVFYQKPKGWGSWAFSDVYAIAGMAWAALAANGIPCRGAISFGEFLVELSSDQQHSIFFGNALIDAYETESNPINSDWIGVTICQSAWKAVEYAEPGVIAILERENRFIRTGDVLRLNPFMKLGGWHIQYQMGEMENHELPNWDKPDFPNDVLALDFILTTAEEHRSAASEHDRVAAKYLKTGEILTTCLGEECVNWARALAPAIRR